MSFDVPLVRSPDVSLSVRAAIDGDEPECTLEISAAGKLADGFAYPDALASRTGDRLIVPYCEGLAFPVEESEPDLGKDGRRELPAYSGRLSMPFFGLEGADGSGLMTIIETRFDAVLGFRRNTRDGLLSGQVVWQPQRGEFGYARRLRLVAIARGGYVSMAKRYRRWSQAHGLFLPFAEKAKKRPSVDKLLGAVNFWFCNHESKEAMRMIDILDQCGIKHVLWSADAAAEVVTRLANRRDTLVGRYDIFADVYHPEIMAALGKPGVRGLNGWAWPDDIQWTAPNSNAWARGWSCRVKDGSLMPTARMCVSRAPKYARSRIDWQQKNKPFNARFLDTVTHTEMVECYNPAHPMTRTDCYHASHKLLEVVNGEFGLVTGSETGNDAFVDVCDYYEGLLSISQYRVPDSGRDIEKIWLVPPEKTAKYQLGEKYRIPLWELVYHECLSAHWFWGDHQNKLPTLWTKRDLFNVLYGTMPMFLVTGVEQFEKDRARFVKSYEMTSSIARATGYAEMIEHHSLVADHSVQQSRFADGTVVTVNFGDKDYVAFDGVTVPSKSHRVSKCKQMRTEAQERVANRTFLVD